MGCVEERGVGGRDGREGREEGNEGREEEGRMSREKERRGVGGGEREEGGEGRGTLRGGSSCDTIGTIDSQAFCPHVTVSLCHSTCGCLYRCCLHMNNYCCGFLLDST